MLLHSAIPNPVERVNRINKIRYPSIDIRPPLFFSAPASLRKQASKPSQTKRIIGILLLATELLLHLCAFGLGLFRRPALFIAVPDAHLVAPGLAALHDAADQRLNEAADRLPHGLQHGPGLVAHRLHRVLDLLARGVAQPFGLFVP